MAQDTGAPLLVSNCPFCLTMFEDGIKTGGCEGELAGQGSGGDRGGADNVHNAIDANRMHGAV